MSGGGKPLGSGTSTAPGKDHEGLHYPGGGDEGGRSFLKNVPLPPQQKWAVRVQDGSNLVISEKRNVGGLEVLVSDEDGSLWVFDLALRYAIPLVQEG